VGSGVGHPDAETTNVRCAESTRERVTWAHASPNAKNLVETRLSGRLHINSQILVAGA